MTSADLFLPKTPRSRARRPFFFFALAISVTLLAPTLAQAWDDKTHMAIAYVAYHKLNRRARDRVDEILVLHPLYALWTRDAKLGQAGFLAFLHAATWPNCIQTPECPGYTEDGTEGGLDPTAGQEEWQNIGFSDMLMHKYWHSVGMPYVSGQVEAGEVTKPNLETQLQILTEALDSNADDRLKAYDLAWVANLVGELNQPLNCVSRYSVEYPNGDQNGRAVKVHSAPAADNLHDYWDELLGNEHDMDSVIKEGKALAKLPDRDGWWEAVDIERWVNESVELAKRSVYTPAVISQENSHGGPIVLDEAYRKAATEAAMQQAARAGTRLAWLLNSKLK